MKRFFIEKLMKLAFIAALAVMTFATSCKEEDEPTPVEDGIYVKGAGTALTDFDAKGLMKPTKNEVGSVDRPSLYELYVAVKGGADGFNIVIVTGGEPVVYGPGADFDFVELVDRITDEPKTADLWRGSYSVTDTKFTVETDGLYHVVIDTELDIVTLAKVEWGIIGGATQNGWGGSTALTSSAFDLNTMSFTGTDIILTAGDFKFRYSDGWKIVLDGEVVRVNTNFGGTVAALVPGGANIANTVVGKYTITVTWNLDGGTTATVTKTGDYTPPAYPSAMYIVGSATAYGWDAPGTYPNALMHKCAGGAPTEGIFWKICYLTGGEGFKLAANGWGDPNLGFGDVDEYDATGVTVSDAGGNMSVATSGMYIVVLNLRDNLKKVSVKEAEVYGIGNAFGGLWDEAVPAYKFTIDNVAKTLVSPALTAADNVRMYAEHAWIPAWWNAEFNLYAGVIEYRNDGGDQTAVPGTVGQVFTLHFDDNTGSVAK
jgi:hypothetical protein